MHEIPSGEINRDVERRNPDATSVENPYIGRVDVGVSSIDRREDAETLPDRTHVQGRVNQVDQVRGAVLAKELPHVYRRVGRWIDAKGERCDLGVFAGGELAKGLSENVDDDRAALLAR